VVSSAFDFPRWFRADDGEDLRAVVEDSRVSATDELLVIQHAEEGDAGRWVCMANNSVGSERVDVTLRVVAPLGVAVRPPGPVTADMGTRLELHCSVTGGGGGPPVVSWLKVSVGPGRPAVSTNITLFCTALQFRRHHDTVCKPALPSHKTEFR